MKKLIPIVFLMAGAVFFSCEKTYDSPPENILPVGSIITMDSLRNMYQGEKLKIEDDLSIYATVTMDEADGNIYKALYLQDATGAVNVRTLFSGAAFEGDYVRLALKGTVLSDYNGVIQLDSVDNDVNIIRQSSNQNWTPQRFSLQEVINNGILLESQLITVDSVQFLTEQLGETYADIVNQSSVNRDLVDCNGNSILVRTSGFSDFAGENVAEGHGSITAVLSHYKGELQLYIRSYDEFVGSMSGGTRCDDGTFRALYKENFETTSLSNTEWTTQVISGGFDWDINLFSNNSFVAMSNFSGGYSASETWLISPAYDLSETTNPILEFQNSKNYAGTTMEVYVSQDFDISGPVSNANWTKLTPTLSTGNWDWVSSGALDLSAMKAANVHVAFKYVGSDTDGATWQVDDVLIREN